jgi:hypothetical protein
VAEKMLPQKNTRTNLFSARVLQLVLKPWRAVGAAAARLQSRGAMAMSEFIVSFNNVKICCLGM